MGTRLSTPVPRKKRSDAAKGRSKTAPPHRYPTGCGYYTETKTHLSTRAPRKKKEATRRNGANRAAPRVPRPCHYYIAKETYLSTPTHLFPRGSLKIRGERCATVECLRRDDASVDLVVGSHCRFILDEDGHAPHTVLLLGVYRPRVETLPKSASCAAADCPPYGVGGYARVTCDFSDTPPFQPCLHSRPRIRPTPRVRGYGRVPSR